MSVSLSVGLSGLSVYLRVCFCRFELIFFVPLYFSACSSYFTFNTSTLTVRGKRQLYVIESQFPLLKYLESVLNIYKMYA